MTNHSTILSTPATQGHVSNTKGKVVTCPSWPLCCTPGSHGNLDPSPESSSLTPSTQGPDGASAACPEDGEEEAEEDGDEEAEEDGEKEVWLKKCE